MTKCFNPAERGGAKIHALESRLRNMALAERRRYLNEHGVDVPAVEEYLAGAQCGGIGEAALRDFATRPPSDFSAGFVSLGAGVLLAAALLQNTQFSRIKPKRRDMATLNYLNGGLGEAFLAADAGCELNCRGRMPVVSPNALAS